jgi:hypothetical protein
MSSLAHRKPDEMHDDEITDELFESLATCDDAAASHVELRQDREAFFATLPDLPSLDGFEARLTTIQHALDDAREEAAAIRQEIRHKAEMLRKVAVALDSV